MARPIDPQQVGHCGPHAPGDHLKGDESPHVFRARYPKCALGSCRGKPPCRSGSSPSSFAACGRGCQAAPEGRDCRWTFPTSSLRLSRTGWNPCPRRSGGHFKAQPTMVPLPFALRGVKAPLLPEPMKCIHSATSSSLGKKRTAVFAMRSGRLCYSRGKRRLARPTASALVEAHNGTAERR